MTPPSSRACFLSIAMAVGVVAGASSEAAATEVDRSATLRDADLAMSRAVGARDATAFALHVDEEALWGGRTGFLDGRAAVLAAWARYTAPGGSQLTWQPTEAALSRTGDLGYTAGTYRWEGKGSDGKLATAEGRYLTVWRRGKDGAYRALFDMELRPASPALVPVRTPVRRLDAAAGDLRAEVGTWRGSSGEHGSFLVVQRRGADGAYEQTIGTFVPSSG